MILQALTSYYEVLSAQEKINKPGWSKAKVSFALDLSENGTLERVTDIREEKPGGKKREMVPQILDVPAQQKRASGVSANFLCDNAGYMLGIDSKGKPKRTKQCFDACKALHECILDGIAVPSAQALLAFFRSWNPEEAKDCLPLAEYFEEIQSGVNLMFRYKGTYLSTEPAIRQAWDRYYDGSDGEQGVCLVTGETGPIARLHPSIKNVAGAQSSGASLVSFNAPAFCSYGKEQSLNAPTSQYAAFAYAAALNHLLADREHVYRIGDTTVVCWAEGGGSAYQNLFGAAFFGNWQPSYTEQDIRKAVQSLCGGIPILFDEARLDPKMKFYILGLAPNAARLSVRFFLRNSFGAFLENARRHQSRLEITAPAYDTRQSLSLWSLLDETVNQNTRDKSPTPQLAGETLRAILTDTPYPATLYSGVMLRIRAEREITRGRAAILKAYYLKHPHPEVPEEVLTVSLNENSTCIPYTLGRLFSVLEAIQESANPGINATIKDKYFNMASSAPSHVFPMLMNLAQKHLRKLEVGTRVWYDKQLTELMDTLGEEFPDKMSLPMQGSFLLGYYQQKQKRYEKRA